MYKIIRTIYRLTLKPILKGILLLKSWFVIFWRVLVFRLIKGQKVDPYKIKIAYVTRFKNIHFNDSENKDEFQDAVYKKIKKFYNEKQLCSIIDIGCGSGYKLMKYFRTDRLIGMELPPALDFLKNNYPQGTWKYSDFSHIPDIQYDMVISIDVIEHLADPDDLIKYIIKLNPKYIALCTPDRDKMSYRSQCGPPINKAHKREWSKKEFSDYLEQYFDIIESGIVDFQDHLIIAKPKT